MSRRDSGANPVSWRGEDAEFWAATADGAAWGAATYPLLLGGYGSFIARQRQPLDWHGDALQVVVIAILGAFLVYFFTLVLASIYGIVCEKLFNRLDINSRRLWVGGLVGGLAALTLTLTYVVPLIAIYQDHSLAVGIVSSLVFSVPATILGQAGAIWGGRLKLSARQKRESRNWIANLPRFSIAMMLWLTVAGSTVLGLLKLMGLEGLILFLVLSSVLQSLALPALLFLERAYTYLRGQPAEIGAAANPADCSIPMD